MVDANRALAIAAAALLLLVGTIGTVEAVRWIGKPFPGFLVLENRVVASVGLSHWAATRSGRIFQHEIFRVDREPLERASDLHERIRSLPVGTPIVYDLRRGDRRLERTLPTEIFAGRDFLLLFGVYLLNGLVMGGTALVLCFQRSAAARAAVPLLLVGALWGLSAMDLYGPYHLFRLHALCEAMLFAAALHMAVAFPHPLRPARLHRGIVGLLYGCAAGLALVYQADLSIPDRYVSSHLLATSALGASLLALLGALFARFLWPPSLAVRRQIRALAGGALLSLALPVVLTLTEVHTGGRMPQNAVGFTAFLLPLAVGYAATRDPGRAGAPPDG